MAPLILMLLQAATVAVPDDTTSDCPAHPDEIIVCHKRSATSSYRLPLRGDALPVAKVGPPRAEWGLGGGIRMNLSAQSGAMPQGAVSKRVMATVKIPF